MPALQPLELGAILLLVLVLSSGGRGGRVAPRSGVRWSDDEMRAFVRELLPTGVPLEAMLAIMCAESGLDPAASSGSAWGMHQAQAPLLRAAGWLLAPNAFGRLSVEDQLPWIGKIMRLQVRSIGYVPQDAAELYRLNLSPRAAKARDEVIYRRDEPSEAKFYAGNKGLDHGNKGFISFADLAHTMGAIQKRALFLNHVEQLRRIQSGVAKP